MFRPIKWSSSGPSHRGTKFVTLCDGPDDDHLIDRNMLSMWYLYGN